MLRLLGPLLTTAALLALGCGDADSTAAPGQTDASTGSDFDPATFTGGDFQLTVVKVDDGCLDGGMDLLFMPEGTAQPYDLANVTYMPGKSQLPHTYQMKLQAPFEDMTMTMTDAGGAQMQVREAVQEAVLLSLPGSSDCTATMTIDADVILLTPDSLTLMATATISALTSPTQTCPPLTSEPCAVSMNMTGARLN